MIYKNSAKVKKHNLGFGSVKTNLNNRVHPLLQVIHECYHVATMEGKCNK